MIPEKGVTTHPGEMLLEEFLKPMGITQAEFAQHVDVAVSTISAIIHGRRDITPAMAVKFGQALDVDPATWVSLQSMHDFTKAREALRAKKQLPKVRVMAKVKRAMAEAGAKSGEDSNA